LCPWGPLGLDDVQSPSFGFDAAPRQGEQPAEPRQKVDMPDLSIVA